MPPNGHALLSASSSDRWLHCPPSARLCESYADKGSDYAAEGTDAHALCEYKLRKALGMQAEDPTENLTWFNQEMDDCATGYAAYILELVEAAKETCADPVVLIEQRVDFSRWVEQGFGTSDAILIADGTMHVILSPNGRLSTLINDIAAVYTGTGKKAIDSYREVREYDGTADALVVYKLSTAHELIASEYASFLQVIADPNTENDPFEYTSAYLLKGQITLDNESTPVKLISMQNPVTTLKHKFLRKNGVFEELSDKVLSLRPTMDILVVGETVYFLTLAGENLFNMARSYKAVCQQKIEEVEQANIIGGIDCFKSTAESGHNPRRFIAFNASRLTALKKKNIRVAMAKRFSIPLDDAGDKFDATVEGAAEKIVKLLCNKGMIDPFEKTAVEVDGARQWK